MQLFLPRRILILGVFIVIACILSMQYLDQYLSSFLTDEQNQMIYRPVRELTELGVSNHFFVFCAVVLLACFILLRQKKWNLPVEQIVKLQSLQKWTVTFLYSLLASGAVVQLFKFIFGRQRPHRTDEHEARVFDFFTTNWHNHSFPSGHTQTLFTVATALAFLWPQKSVWFFSSAGLVALTRVLLHEHFLSDLLMGGYIGYAMSLWIFHRRYLSSK